MRALPCCASSSLDMSLTHSKRTLLLNSHEITCEEDGGCGDKSQAGDEGKKRGEAVVSANL